jgi:hypothetical protein
MKKGIFPLMFILSILILSSPLLLRAQDKAVVRVDRANIREKPDLQSPVVTVVTRGTVLQILAQEGEWYRISFTSRDKGVINGYIHQNLVEVIKEITKEKIERKPEPRARPEEKFVRPSRSERGRLRAIGFKLGWSGASLYGANVEEFEEYLEEEIKTKSGFNFGAFIIVNLNSFLALQSELNFVEKGAKTQGEAAGEAYKAWINLNYLEIPAILRFYLPAQNNFHFSFYTGTYVGLKTKGRVKAEVAGIKVESDIENLKSTDAGLIFGAGFDFSLPFLKTGQFCLDLRYSLGLTSISTEAGVETKNKVISLSLGYLF